MAARLSQEDNARLHKLHMDSKALLESLADRLPEQELEQLRSFSFAGEWSLLVDDLCALLVQDRIPVTPGERGALAGVLAFFTTPERGLDYLNDPDGTLAALTIAE